jgi:hypothetical protein
MFSLKELEVIFLVVVLFTTKKPHLLWFLQQNKFSNVSVVVNDEM